MTYPPSPWVRRFVREDAQCWGIENTLVNAKLRIQRAFQRWDLSETITGASLNRVQHGLGTDKRKKETDLKTTICAV
jgi:hypothetical protein